MSGKRGNSALPSLGKTRGKGYTPHTPNHPRMRRTAYSPLRSADVWPDVPLPLRGSDMGERTAETDYTLEEMELAMMGFMPRCGYDGFRYWKLLEPVLIKGKPRQIAFVLVTVLRPDVMARYQVQDRRVHTSARFSVWSTAKAKIVEILETVRWEIP